MNDRQLRYAIAVWHERSFSRAGQRLRVSQPSLSDQVRLLEEEIGFSLFYRTSRGVEPSINGQTFLEAAEQVVQGIADLSELARELRGSPGLTLRIGISSGLAEAMLPPIIRALGRTGSKIRPDVVTANSRRIQRLVHQQRLDLGLLFNGEIKGSNYKLSWEHVAKTEIMALLPSSHALAQRNTPVDFAELVKYPLIVSEPRAGFGQFILAIFAEQELRPDFVADCDDIGSLKYMVMSGAGIALIPRIAAGPEIAGDPLRVCALTPRHAIDMQMVRRPEAMPLKIEQCLGTIGKELAKLRSGDSALTTLLQS